jgi:hypothetical protein
MLNIVNNAWRQYDLQMIEKDGILTPLIFPQKFEDLVVLSPIDDVYVKNSKEDMLDTAFSQPFCRNYYTIQMLRFCVFITIMFGLQNSSWAQIILSLGMAIIFCGLTIKIHRMGC